MMNMTKVLMGKISIKENFTSMNKKIHFTQMED